MNPGFSDFFFRDEPIRAVQEFFGLGHADAFRWMGLLGDTWGMMLVLGLAFWLYGRDTLYAVAGSVALAAVTKMLLSMAFDVPRPVGNGIVVYEEISISSFPSGHVYQTVIPWGVLYVKERLPLLIPLAILFLVSLSRLYLGVHYLTDVVAAALLAVLFVVLYVPAWRAVKTWLYDRSVRFYGLLTLAGAAGVLATIILRIDNARRWQILGLVLGAGTALIVERKWLSYQPPEGWRLRAAAIALGLAGLAAFAVPLRDMQGAPMALHVTVAFALVVWTLLCAPALISWSLGLPTSR